MDRKDLLTPEIVDSIDSMLRKLAAMKINNGHLKMELEDVVSELWINTLKIIDKTGKVDFNYIAHASFYKMVDLTRHNILTESTPYDNESMNRILPENLRNSKLHTGDNRDVYIFSTVKNEDVTEKVELMDILNLFDKDSKEYKLVETWMKILGIIEDDDYRNLPDRAFDRYIASEILGYAGSKSNGYARIRQKVRDALIKAGYCY